MPLINIYISSVEAALAVEDSKGRMFGNVSYLHLYGFARILRYAFDT